MVWAEGEGGRQLWDEAAVVVVVVEEADKAADEAQGGWGDRGLLGRAATACAPIVVSANPT